MNKVRAQTKIRPMELDDLDAIFSIDHKVRAVGEAITYKNLTTERVFTINRHIGRQAKPVSYVDLISGDIQELLDLGLVAEVDGHVRGFILGSRSPLAEAAAEVGVIQIMGVHPDYQRMGIATTLVGAIGDRLRGIGVRRIRVSIDQQDKKLLAFFERLGFDVGHLIDYSRKL
jgi:GNAT superfamily N-acetyltransferase